MHAEEITKASAFAQERAEREARLQRPMFVMPTKGAWTSGFGYRWGVLHGGIDLANSIGTPILAASDGVVIAAGPTGGYGNWVKLRHNDGTVTLYGHLSAWNVEVGQRVWAGDQIAKMGNPEIRRAHTCTSRCFSTAPTVSTRSAGWRNADFNPGNYSG